MKRKLLLLSLIFVLSAFLFCRGVFAVSEPTVSVSLDNESARVGDIIKFTVKAELPENAYIAVNKKILFNNFDTLNMSVERLSRQSNTYLIIFDLAAFKTGSLEIESVGISYITDSGAKKMFFTPSAKVNIESVLPSGQTEIKDIKPVKKIGIKTKYAAGIIGLATIILILFFSIIKERAAKPKEQISADPKTEALSKLELLYESDAVKNGDARLFYYQAAEILRSYISVKYLFNAMEMTSSELLKELDNIDSVSMTKKEIRQYLDIFDLARYAGFKASQQNMAESLKKTKEFIEKL